MTGNPGDVDAPRPRTDWGRVADGIFLAGLGVFFLVAATRGLPEGFWIEAVTFWPVLLVSAGIRIIFDKTAFAAGVILGPLVVLSSLFWLAWGHPPVPRPPGDWHALSAAAPEGTVRARLRADLAGVQLDVDTRHLEAGLLAEGRAASRDGTPRLRIDEGEGQASVRLEGRHGGLLIIGARREVWELGLTETLPLEVIVEGVFIRTRADLRTGRLIHAEVNGAFNAATLQLPRPRAPVAIHLKGAFSSYDVTVPEGTPVFLRGPGFPLNFTDRGPAREGQSEAEPGYNIVVDGAFTAVSIEEGEPPEGGWPALPPRAFETSEDAEADDGPPAEAPPATPEDPSGA
jgi:hypothetical protein